MNEIICKVVEIEQILLNDLPNKDKVIAILKQLSGLELTQLSIRAKKNVEYNLVLLNKILQKYSLTTFGDYEKINKTDLDEILNHLKNICISLHKLVHSKYFYRKTASTDK